MRWPGWAGTTPICKPPHSLQMLPFPFLHAKLQGHDHGNQDQGQHDPGEWDDQRFVIEHREGLEKKNGAVCRPGAVRKCSDCLTRRGVGSAPRRHHIVRVFCKFRFAGVFGLVAAPHRFGRRTDAASIVPQMTLPSPTIPVAIQTSWWKPISTVAREAQVKMPMGTTAEMNRASFAGESQGESPGRVRPSSRRAFAPRVRAHA